MAPVSVTSATSTITTSHNCCEPRVYVIGNRHKHTHIISLPSEDILTRTEPKTKTLAHVRILTLHQILLKRNWWDEPNCRDRNPVRAQEPMQSRGCLACSAEAIAAWQAFGSGLCLETTSTNQLCMFCRVWFPISVLYIHRRRGSCCSRSLDEISCICPTVEVSSECTSKIRVRNNQAFACVDLAGLWRSHMMPYDMSLP